MPVDIEYEVTYDAQTDEFVISQPEKDNVRIPRWTLLVIQQKIPKGIFCGL